MRVLVTGATGFIGSAVVQELLRAGHEVVGLARSDASAEALVATGAGVVRGSLEDLAALRAGAASAGGVVHVAFTNVSPTTDFAAASRADAAAIGALGAGLAGTGKPLVVTSGTGLVSVPDRAVTEEDPANWGPRVAGEEAALALAGQGVRVSVARLSLSVHDGQADRNGFVPALIALAREKGTSAYIGAGANRWTGVHRLDAARLFRLALEGAPAGAKLHGVGDEGVPFRQIAAAIGAGLGLPVTAVAAGDADAHFGYLAPFIGLDNPTSNERTRALLGWKPEHPGLLADIERGGYIKA
ncbi:MAG: NAD-dependent epimerase/dehydratase family protein [Trebonia sp.]|jgi:nucleoside-diphosphate-sugar epimerase